MLEHRYVACKIHQLSNDWKEDRKANYIKYVCLYFVSHCSSQTFFSLCFILYLHPFYYSSFPVDHVYILFFLLLQACVAGVQYSQDSGSPCEWQLSCLTLWGGGGGGGGADTHLHTPNWRWHIMIHTQSNSLQRKKPHWLLILIRVKPWEWWLGLSTDQYWLGLSTDSKNG